MKRFSLQKFAFLLLLFTIIAAASCKKVFVQPIKDAIIKDSVVIRDSVVIVYDTVRVIDTLTIIDTVKYNDSTIYRDTVIYNDTVKIVETIRKIDTVTYTDTIWTEKIIYDTVKVVDTLKVIDSIRVYDTIKVYDTIRVSIPPIVDPPVSSENSILVGNGSGSLTINSNVLDNGSIRTVRIKGGTYSTITLEDLNGAQENPIVVINEGTVYIREVLTTRNINNVQISGAGAGDSDHGIIFENLSYRAISLSGKMNGVTIRNMRFRNVADFVISGDGSNGSGLRYDGTSNTRTERLKILNCIFDNTGSIMFGGSLSRNGDTGFFKDVEIAYNSFTNSEAGGVCSFTNVEDYNIHHNSVNNVNQQNNNHNGVFYMQGSGNFYSNKLTNYQGNAIRAWVFSRGSEPVTIEIYNNICYNTRKYGGFEIQEFSDYIIAGKTTYANAKVYNNTVGKMNTTHDWQGQLLDLYNISGTLSYYNNLGFDLYSDDSYHPVTNMINNMGGTKIILDSNNLYFSNQTDAVSNISSFTTKHTGIGATLNL